MKRKFRLTRTTDYKRVRLQGRSYAHPLVVLWFIPNNLGRSRFAVTATRSVGGAVQRNRARRRVRAALLLLQSRVRPGWDLIIICRKGLLSCTFDEIQSGLTNLLSRAKLIQETHDQFD